MTSRKPHRDVVPSENVSAGEASGLVCLATLILYKQSSPAFNMSILITIKIALNLKEEAKKSQRLCRQQMREDKGMKRAK